MTITTKDINNNYNNLKDKKTYKFPNKFLMISNRKRSFTAINTVLKMYKNQLSFKKNFVLTLYIKNFDPFLAEKVYERRFDTFFDLYDNLHEVFDFIKSTPIGIAPYIRLGLLFWEEPDDFSAPSVITLPFTRTCVTSKLKMKRNLISFLKSYYGDLYVHHKFTGIFYKKKKNKFTKLRVKKPGTFSLFFMQPPHNHI